LDILDAVKNTTNVKVVLRIKDPTEAADLADMVLNYNLESPVHALTKPAVVGYRLVELKGKSASEQQSKTLSRTDTQGESVTHAHGYAEMVAETAAESTGIGETFGRSSAAAISVAAGASSANVIGVGEGLSTTNSFDPNAGFLVPMVATGIAQGSSTQMSISQAAGSNTIRGSNSIEGFNSGTSISKSSSRAVTHAATESESVSLGKSTARSHGEAATSGHSTTQSAQEAFEPIYEDRPSAVHGMENIRYMAAQVLRNLTAGRAAISFVDALGLKSEELTVANVVSCVSDSHTFNEIRERVFEASPSALRSEEARRVVAQRERDLMALAGEARDMPEPDTPAGYRTKIKRVNRRTLVRKRPSPPAVGVK
jgi:hypothetical protein